MESKVFNFKEEKTEAKTSDYDGFFNKKRALANKRLNKLENDL